VLAIALLLNAERATMPIILAWGLVSLWSNNGVIWITAIIATIAMGVVSRTSRVGVGPVPTPTAESVDPAEHIGPQRVYALIPIIRIPTPWLWYTWDRGRKVLTQEGWFIKRGDPLYLKEVQDCRYSNALVRAICGTATLESMSKKIHVDHYLPWHRLPAWLALEVADEVANLKQA